MNKRNKILTIALGIFLFVAVIGASYAYFAIDQNTSSNQASIQTGNVVIVLDDVDPITQTDAIDPNNLTITRYLTIRNESTQDGYVNILFKNLVNTFVTNDLVYSLEEINSDKTSLTNPLVLVDSVVIPKSSTAVDTTLTSGLLIPADTSKYYKLVVHYNYRDDVNQDDDLGKVLTSGFAIEEGVPQTLTVTLNVGENASISSNTVSTIAYKTFDSLPTPTRDGYNFVSWYLDSELTKQVTSSTIALPQNTTLYAKWKEKNKIYCVNESDTEITCPETLQVGQRIAIGRDANVQYFRYVRTTDTSDTEHLYNDYNNPSDNISIACTDADTNNPLPNNNLRLLAENNLNVRYVDSSSTEGLQLKTVNGSYNSSYYYGSTGYGYSTYATSNIKPYIETYASTLNTMYYNGNSVFSGDGITMEEIKMLGCNQKKSSSYLCTSQAPSWVYNVYYWTRSTYGSTYIWANDRYSAESFGGHDRGNGNWKGVRPIIMVDRSKLYE